MNPSSKAFETHENGSLLGCVIFGSGNAYQLMVYNGQKIPQVAIAMSSSFLYNIQGQYMSFSDTQGNSWSAYFEALDTLQQFQRMIVYVLAHIASHTEASASSGCLKATLSSDSSSSNALALGMTVGLYLTIWEVGNISSYPDDVTRNHVFSINPSHDVMKLQ